MALFVAPNRVQYRLVVASLKNFQGKGRTKAHGFIVPRQKGSIFVRLSKSTEEYFMYRISVPVKNDSVSGIGKELLCEELRKFGASRVFLAIGTYELDFSRRKKMLDELRDNCKYFKEQGFEVGAWLWTFWIKNKKEFKCMRSIDGDEITDFVCPSDENFLKFASEYIKDVAKCGVDLIQFDDDFRYGFLSGSTGCLCENHIKAINQSVNQSLSLEQIHKHIISGENNCVRDGFLQANGEYFKRFALSMRKAVDKVNPSIRLGACACMSSWDVDGTDARELAYILAGNTRPFVRLIGAPYWAVNKSWGNSLQDVCELERMESAWTKDGNIEIIAEGDTWPRPRTNCPASYLEGFDTAMRVSGSVDGILKYGIDYYSNLGYETGYADAHKRNLKLYGEIDRIFASKGSVGVRVYESMKKIGNMVMPTAVNTEVNIENLFFSKSARMLAYNTVPTVYEGDGLCGIAFDENARELPKNALEKGLILDIAAAEILTQKGIDVGICKIGKAIKGLTERFLNDGNRILTGNATAYEIEINNTAEVLSVIECGEKEIPFSYKYENEQGQRFFVLNVNTREETDVALKNYARGKQLSNVIEWLGGEKLPAYSHGHPALYIQCKEGKDKLSVGLWNFFADPVYSCVVELGRNVSSVKGVNCNAMLDKHSVVIDEIHPFGFAFFEVTTIK